MQGEGTPTVICREFPNSNSARNAVRSAGGERRSPAGACRVSERVLTNLSLLPASSIHNSASVADPSRGILALSDQLNTGGR